MGKIAGDGSDIVMVNGRQVRYQGIGHIKKDVATSAAVEKTANDGYKKYFLESPDHKDRLLVFGDRLDFSFISRQTVPQVVVNGKAYILVAHDDQDASWFEGFVNGAKNGIAQAGAATVEAAKQVISQIGVAGSLAVVGGTAFAIWRGVKADVITGTASALAIPALKIVGAVIALGTVVAGVAAGIKGAADVGAKKHDTKAIASVLDPSIEGENPDPAPDPQAPATEEPAGEPSGAIPVVPGSGEGPPSQNPSKAPATPGRTYRILPVEPGTNPAARRLGAALQDLEQRSRTPDRRQPAHR